MAEFHADIKPLLEHVCCSAGEQHCSGLITLPMPHNDF